MLKVRELKKLIKKCKPDKVHCYSCNMYDLIADNYQATGCGCCPLKFITKDSHACTVPSEREWVII